MIVDRFMQLLLSIFNSLLSVLPEAGAAPGWIGALQGVFKATNFLLPAVELLQFIPTMVLFLGLLQVWRAVRLFLPGG